MVHTVTFDFLKCDDNGVQGGKEGGRTVYSCSVLSEANHAGGESAPKQRTVDRTQTWVPVSALLYWAE